VGRIDHSTYQAMMKDEAWSIVDFKIGDDAEVEMLGRNVAVVAYSVHEDMTVDVEPVCVDAADSSTWFRRDGRWLCASHTESFIGDSFGRDRDRTPRT
jgi:hypothetical protein